MVLEMARETMASTRTTSPLVCTGFSGYNNNLLLVIRLA